MVGLGSQYACAVVDAHQNALGAGPRAPDDCGGARLTQPSGLRFGLDGVHGAVANPGSCTATTSIVAPVTALVDASVVTFDAATLLGSWAWASIFAGMTTKTPMVIAVMATAVMPRATRGVEVS